MVYKTIMFLLVLVCLPFRVEAAGTKEEDMNEKKDKKQNRLADATSPYLQAHAENPVDWYEWGEEAFAKAGNENKPIFLSIGYNACHWCHVMERESFEDDTIAALLNKYFVSIKVDREERPDIDEIYMAAVQAMTGGGGWPMSVFLTPDKKPFFAGTYFPPQSMYGRPGFREVVEQLGQGYHTQHDEILKSADAIVDHIAKVSSVEIPGRNIDERIITSAAQAMMAQLDRRFGGFGTEPKFPQAANLSFLFRAGQISGNKDFSDAALFTLEKMAEGGIYDQFGGGFHRYATDARWLVPHFEKMLYDNALLVIPYLEAYQVSGDDKYLEPVHGTLGYLQSEMTSPEGGLYSTQDADSEGEEGKFYVWKKKEVEAILGDDADWFCRYFDIDESGNFEGKSIPNRGEHSREVEKASDLSEERFHERLEELKNRLLADRKKRVAPATDDKILASWNGLAVSAFARAYQVTGREDYLESARKAADFVIASMTEEGKLYHSYREGRLLKTELLEDYAYFIAGLIDLYQSSFDENYLDHARKLTDRAVTIFSTDDTFYSAPEDSPDLIYRPRDLTDGATPSPASVMILSLHRLAAITGDEQLAQKGDAALDKTSGLAAQMPQASAALLTAGHFRLKDPLEIVISGKNRENLESFNSAVHSRFIPNKIVVGSINGQKSDLPLLEGRQDNRDLTFYFCVNRSCRLPVTELAALNDELDRVIEQIN